MKPFNTRTWFIWVATLAFVSSSVFGGPLTRVANTTLRMPTNPPTFGYTTANAFPSLTFTNPTTIVSAPGETNRLFVVEKRGRIVAITNLAAPTRTIFMDLSARVVTSAGDTGGGVGEERGLLGMAFHPGYATNGFFYVFYTGNATKQTIIMQGIYISARMVIFTYRWEMRELRITASPTPKKSTRITLPRLCVWMWTKGRAALSPTRTLLCPRLPTT